MRRVLISGASIAGPALAYWLDRYGFEVTVVEKAPTVRQGGYPIDVRGSAIDVCERMGLGPALREANIKTRRMTMLAPDGRVAGRIDTEQLLAGTARRDVEVPRGELGDLLYALTKDRVEYVFGDSIRTLDQTAGGVDLTFTHGAPRTVDVVVGCDGQHSVTRRLAFGPEQDYSHYLGYCFAGFTAPNTDGLSHEAVLQNAPGVGTALYAVREQPWVHALLVFTDPQPARGWTADDLRDRVAARFAGVNSPVPGKLADAPDLYYDTVSQIKMPSWTTGRVALAGDAAYAPSFLSGQGTSLALTGAYVLAGELKRSGGELTGAYEQTMRDFVRDNQAMATGPSFLFPRTRHGLWLRNQSMRMAPLMSRIGSRIERNATALRIEDY
ncbi:FAD-dependent monooxygenase [Catenuloplanes japonicus]|uniref:FAD-dependent monooxygenase n=1 Tax=Catenuloplanes japonicus TaxID=33876 RepID=UPI0007C577BD|nr:FAD-dependent monooxygenase [Catenuloplanes japonicus]